MTSDNRQPEVVARCDDWIVVNKPRGWHSVRLAHPDAEGDAEPVLQDWLARQCPAQAELTEAGLVHRLDHLTSGCILAARSAESAARLKGLIAAPHGGIAKTYLAMVQGPIGPGSFDLYFQSRYRRSRRITVRDTGSERERGRCAWRVRQEAPGRTVLEVDLIGPGRRHQIRAGLAHLGHPLLGDDLYGGPEWDGRFGLHAWRLVIEGHRVEAPAPVEWCI